MNEIAGQLAELTRWQAVLRSRAVSQLMFDRVLHRLSGRAFELPYRLNLPAYASDVTQCECGSVGPLTLIPDGTWSALVTHLCASGYRPIEVDPDECGCVCRRCKAPALTHYPFVRDRGRLAIQPGDMVWVMCCGKCGTVERG